jgi:hypothetical protein
VSPPVRQAGESTVDDEQPVGGDYRHDRRRRHTTDTPRGSPHLEHRRLVRIDIGQDTLDCAATATCEREADAVSEPIAGDRTGRGEPPTLAHCNRH